MGMDNGNVWSAIECAVVGTYFDWPEFGGKFYPASVRETVSQNYPDIDRGFRITLYIK